MEAAEPWAETWLADLPVAIGGPRPPAVLCTLGQAMQAFADHLRAGSGNEGMSRQYRTNWNTRVPADNGAISASRATLAHDTAIIDGITAERRSLGTLVSVVRTVNAVLTLAEPRDFFGGGPAVRQHRRAEPRGRQAGQGAHAQAWRTTRGTPGRCRLRQPTPHTEVLFTSR